MHRRPGVRTSVSERRALRHPWPRNGDDDARDTLSPKQFRAFVNFRRKIASEGDLLDLSRRAELFAGTAGGRVTSSSPARRAGLHQTVSQSEFYQSGYVVNF